MPGRMRGAWQVLMGQRLVPFQIQSEWALYQQTFQGQLEAFSSYLARSAKAEKKRLERIQDDLGEQPVAEAEPTDRESRKAALNSKAAALRGMSRPHILPFPEAPDERSTQGS